MNAGQKKKLRQVVQRADRLRGERANLANDLREVYAEAREAGLDVRTIKQMVKERAMDQGVLEERREIADEYRAALANTPLEQAIRQSKDTADNVTPLNGRKRTDDPPEDRPSA